MAQEHELHDNIRKVYDNDRVKDKWFKDHNMKLIRITDQQLLQYQKEGNFSMIFEQLGGCENVYI